MSSGDTVLPSDLLILADLIDKASPHCGQGIPIWSTLRVIAQDSHQGAALLTMPWQSNSLNGSSTECRPKSLSALVQNLA